MQSKKLVLALLAITWIAAAEAFVLLAAAGLLALKGAALVGYGAGQHRRRYHHGHSHGHYHGHRHGRAIADEASEQGENILLATVGRLDDNGCILKLLCTLQFKEESELTIHETILIDMFANSTETITDYNAAFVSATNMGFSNQDPIVCEKYFSECTLNSGQLGNLLQEIWGCGTNILGENPAGQDPQNGFVPQQA